MKRGLFWLAFGSAAGVTVLACWAAWVFMIRPMDEAVKTANRLQQIVSKGFEITPRISANAGVLFSQSSRVENLVTATRNLSVEWPLDLPLENGIRPVARAEFLAEAGITGRESMEINLHRGGRTAGAKIPKAKILDLRLNGTPALTGDARWENLPERTQSRVLRQLRLEARKRALDTGLTAEADRVLRGRLQAFAAEAGCELVFETPDSP